MAIEPEDPILDAMLDEVLAGRSPPDLTAQILQAWAARRYGGVSAGGKLSASTALSANTAPVDPSPVLASLPQVFEAPVIEPIVSSRATAHRSERRRESFTAAMAISVAAAVVGLGVTIGLVAVLRSGSTQVAVVPKNLPAKAARTPKEIAKAPPVREPKPVRTSVAEEQPRAASQLVQQTPVEPAVKTPEESQAAPLPFAVKDNAVKNSAAAVVTSAPKEKKEQASPDGQIVSFVNAELSRVWKEGGVKPTPAVGDAEWCQRLFVRLLGRASTADELKSLADDKSATRREKLVERLLTQSNYVEEYSRHWSAVLTNVFLGKSSRAGTLASREELEKYFASALQANKPYNTIAQELLTATGSLRVDAEDYNPAVNFLLDGLDASAAVPTARVARVLLGHQLQCAQCHKHPTQDWTQEQYWAFNACLRQIQVERKGGAVRLVNADRPGGGEVTFETPDGVTKSVRPGFVDGTEVIGDDAASRRQALARLVVDSGDFSRAIVNRVWAQLFDYGFTRPVDDLGPHSSSSAPAVLNRLATEFAAHDFDLKRLMRWAVLSDSFARSSKLTDLASKDMPEEGEMALFSRYYARPARGAEAFGALVQAGRIRTSAGSRTEVEKARIDWLTQANRTATKGGKTDMAKSGPAVMVQSGDPLHRAASGDPTGLVKKIAASKMPPEKQIEHLFLAGLARQPLPREEQAALQLIKSSQGNPSAALEDIWWALQNSNDCVLDH